MPGFGELIQKTFYLGVGLASYAGEKAGETFKDVRGQAQKIVDELVARGEMTSEEAQQLINDMVNRAQQGGDVAPPKTNHEPRQIEILEDDESSSQQTEHLRRQVEALRQELEKLKRDN